ncbi:hypothetical protein X777_12854 [Ooceraea biroi]|uniref:Uncharacterized protein n=1 Tax=Ooceraea biroi TaxID=2015173 RepID=A0A026VZ19_OOCBI|nr:hypothetical protein X777_12854 [Ooceraea biroi]
MASVTRTFRRLITFIEPLRNRPVCERATIPSGKTRREPLGAASRSAFPRDGKAQKKGPGVNYSACSRAHLWKRSGRNGELDYRPGEESEQRKNAREIAGSLTAIRLRGDASLCVSRSEREE